MNKLTLKDQFLSLEQAKELQELGIDFSNSSMGFLKGELKIDYFPVGNKSTEHIPTLSVAEMMEMLPKVFIGNLNSLWFLEITCKATHKDYQVRYIVSDSPCYCNIQIEFRRTLIRDALFEMLKWLKQNKLM